MLTIIPHTHQMSGSSQPILKTHHYRKPSRGAFPRQWIQSRSRSLVRVFGAIFLLIIVFSAARRHFYPRIDEEAIKAEQTVLGNCASIEALRHADECFEAFDFSRGKTRKPNRTIQKQSTHLNHEEHIPWVSSYGLVLDYDAAYDRFATHKDDEHYTTKRTLKCLTGFHMSIVWDIEFSTSLLSAYGNGMFGLSPNTTNEIATSCPPFDSESSASMSIKINCGFDIKRDAWGHPADETDHEELETCIRMAWSWVRGRAGDPGVGPWSRLCHEDVFGELRCDRDVFHLEGSD